ncbi:hypothetical protein U9M48_004026 [Paspalum notatum var. saurae]|uniref:DUF4216 domain-containing protein n=1 Tax=Paspalum notatum var. saurae TaxID=547442 RepID=A0AAQ3PKM7_PASNO
MLMVFLAIAIRVVKPVYMKMIRALGPCYLHEMWTYERFMSTLNRYVLNRACLEGSMIEAYCTEEVVECCQDYLKDKKGINLVESRYTRRLCAKGTRGKKTIVNKDYNEVTTWQTYVINGYIFYTAEKDKKSACQINGVRIEALDTMGQKVTYYGFIEDIWELDYEYTIQIQIPVFRCQWVKHPQGVQVDNFGLTIVDLANVGYKDDPWVLGSRVAQVFYVRDPSCPKKEKHIVVASKQKIIGVDGVKDIEAYNEYENLQLFTDVPTKIEGIESSIKCGTRWLRNDGEPKIVTG